MLRATIIVLLPVLFMASAAFAQSPNLDSLEQSLFKAKTVEEKVRLRLEIGEHSKSESEALRNFETAKKMAIGQSNALNASVHSAIAVFYSRNGDLELAISEKLKEVVIWRSANVRTELADALFGLAKIQRDAYNLDDALRTNREAGDLYGSLENYSKQIECLNRLGIIHKNLQNYAQALPLYHEAYNLSVKYGLEGKKSSTCINIGVILKNQENYDGALEQYYIAEEISLDSKNYGNLASIYNNIGNVLRLKKDFDKALKYYQLALDNRKKSGKKRDLGYTYNNMSIVYKEQGDLNQAARYLKKAEKAKIEVKDYESIAATYLNFAELYLESQSNANFEKYASLAEKYATQFEQAEILREVRINYGKFEANNGNYKEAYYYLEHVFDELDTLDEGSQKILTSVLQAHFKDEQNQSLIRTLSKTNAQLDKRTKELEEKEETSKMLIAALGFGTLILIVLTLLWFFKQRAYWKLSQEMNRINEQLKVTMISKEEKETLLKEIHHRVKNNLQIIKSLIRLQNNGEHDERTRGVFLDFEQRISSMALVHESMYKSGDLTLVDIGQYYHDLTNDLIDAYNLELEVKKEISVDIENLGVDTLVPLGLLTNEIISNSLKHAFIGRKKGTIKVDLQRADGCKVLSIGDDGIGFDFESASDNDQTLGLELIKALVEQLDGEYEFNNDEGSHFRIKFDCE